MGLDYAIDELYATGWSALDSAGCALHGDGRAFPGMDRVADEFRDAGYELNVRYIQLFDCYRAEWRDASGAPQGGVVGSTASEAAVYALAQLRRKALAQLT